MTRHAARRCLRPAAALLLLAGGLSSGCAAITNPVADGIPVRRLPDEVLGTPRADLKPLPLTSLRQKPPAAYKLAAGDILGVVIEGVLGERNQPPPVRFADVSGLPPAIGYPVSVQDDGTILLPYVEPLPVKDMTLNEVRDLIRETYTKKKEILKLGTERIIVTLLQPRRYNVLVVREDGGAGGGTLPAGQFSNPFAAPLIGNTRRGTGSALELPAYENDVLNALTRTGGLPGLEAKNEVIIQRGQPSAPGADATPAPPEILRIPLRLRPGEPIPFKPEDIILRTGDIVYVQARDSEVFYTAGLIGSGQFPLPRDYDLDVVQAIALVRGPLVNGGFTQNFFVATSTNSGLGSPSPSLVTVLRQTANGQQIPIRVDLNRAMRDPRERILIQAGDILVMQERPSEAVVRYITQQFQLNFLSTILRRRDAIATTNVNVP